MIEYGNGFALEGTCTKANCAQPTVIAEEGITPKNEYVAPTCNKAGSNTWRYTKDGKEYTLYNLREGVGMVLQKNVLFSGTIEENLRWGDENATNEEMFAAAENAQADKFVRNFTNGYQTELGQGGVNVSGGQKQRLCIARALLKKPKIIILDDSTSAVDTATEAQIRRAFREELGSSTKIIIAQRISSVKDADMIVVMDDGKITGVGTHDSLMESNIEYQEIYNSQISGKDGN